MLLTQADIKDSPQYPTITFRVTPDEHLWIKQQAHRANLTVSKWLKKRIFQPGTDINPIPKLNRIITALNQTNPDTATAIALAQQLIQDYSKSRGQAE